MDGGPSKGHMEHQYATDARFREFERIMAWDKNAPGSIMLGYDWYRSSLTDQNIFMRTKFCGFDPGLTDVAQSGLEAYGYWAARKGLKAAAESGLKALAVELGGVVLGPLTVAVAAWEVYSWTTWDTSFVLRNSSPGLPPIMPVPTP